MFKGMDKTYLAGRNYLYEVDSSWALTPTTAWFADATWWDFADFGTFVVFSNGSTNIIVDVATTTYHFATAVEFPLCKTMCNLNGQLVIGNTARGANFVEWSEIGYLEFTPGQSNVAGYRPLPTQGEVLRLLPLRVEKLGGSKEERQIVAYCSDGIFLLTPQRTPAVTYGMDRLTDFGITTQGAVGGDENQHLFIDEHGFLRRLTTKGIDRLGYQEFLTTILDTDIRIQHDSAENEWFICNEDYGFKLTENGLSQMSQIVSGGFTAQGAFIGARSTPASLSYEWITDTFDFGIRAGKTIEAVELSGVNLQAAEVCAYWQKPDGSFGVSPWFPVNQELIAYPKTYGTNLRIGVRTSTAGAEFKDELRIRWKLTDKRAIRGMYGFAKASAGSDQ